VQTIIGDLLSPRERPLVQSYVSLTFMSASILGPVLGGLLTDHLHWSFIFWLNLPLGTVALVMTSRALRRRLLTAREPFIPLMILRGRVTSAMTCASFFAIGTIIGVTVYAPLYCQVVLGATASVSGLALIAFMVGTTVGSLAAGRLIVGLTHYMRVPVVGLVIAIVVLAFLAAFPARLSLGAFALVLGVLGVGLGSIAERRKAA
jgi:MFS family permease